MNVKIKFPVRKNIETPLKLQLQTYGLNYQETEDRIQKGSEIGRDMIREAYNMVNEIYKKDPAHWIIDYRMSSPLFKEWFGEITKPRQFKRIRNRLKGISNRYNSGFTVAIKPDSKGTPLAQTAGAANVTKNRFRVYPRLLKRDAWDIADTFVHEIGHHWFTDQKIEKVKVYGENRAKDLAKYNPRKARRSTENYSLFCRKVFEVNGKLVESDSRFFAAAEFASIS